MNNEKIVSQWQMTDVMAKPVKNRNFLSPALLVAVGKDRSGKRPAPVADRFFSLRSEGALNVSTEDVYLLTILNKKFDFPN